MIKKTITYTDYNGTLRTEDFFFNITKAEAADIELGIDGGFSEMANQIVKSQSKPKLLEIFKKMIRLSYGVKSAEGRRFMKSDAIWDEFAQTEAYSILFMELGSNAEKAAEFFNGILPADVVKEASKATPAIEATTN
jgi:hypothetical protein